MPARSCSGESRCSRTTHLRAPAAQGRARRRRRRRMPPPASFAQLLLQALADDARVGLAARLLHHLADEEPEQALLPAAVLRDLTGGSLENTLDDRVEIGDCSDHLLGK